VISAETGRNGDAANTALFPAETSSLEQLQMVFRIQLLDKCFQLISAGHQLRTTADGLQIQLLEQMLQISTETSAVSCRWSSKTHNYWTKCFSDFLRNYSRTDGDAANATLISAGGMARTTADGLQNTAIRQNASAWFAETTARTTLQMVFKTQLLNASAISARNCKEQMEMRMQL
jgi:hypothetical protein